MKRVTFELPDNAAAISMAIVISDFVGATLVTKSYGGNELADGAVNEWTEPELREVKKTFERSVRNDKK